MAVVATQGYYTGLHIPSQLPIIAVHRAHRNSPPSRAEWYRSENGRAAVVERNSKSMSRAAMVKNVVSSSPSPSITDSALGGNYKAFHEISLGNRLRCEKIGRLDGATVVRSISLVTTATLCWLRAYKLKPVSIATVKILIIISPFRTHSYCLFSSHLPLNKHSDSWHALNS